MKEKFLTVAEAARQKGVSRTTIYKAIAEKKLPTIILLGRTALKSRDVTRWQPSKQGRRKGTPMSDAAKVRISRGQKQRWAQRKRKSAKHE